MSKPKKLTDEELIAICDRQIAGYYGVPGEGYLSPEAAGDVDSLLQHIAVMEAEQRAWASRTASDAFEVGYANATFIEQQTQRIQELEQKIQVALDAWDNETVTYTISSDFDNTMTALRVLVERK